MTCVNVENIHSIGSFACGFFFRTSMLCQRESTGSHGSCLERVKVDPEWHQASKSIRDPIHNGMKNTLTQRFISQLNGMKNTLTQQFVSQFMINLFKIKCWVLPLGPSLWLHEQCQHAWQPHTTWAFFFLLFLGKEKTNKAAPLDPKYYLKNKNNNKKHRLVYSFMRKKKN